MGLRILFLNGPIAFSIAFLMFPFMAIYGFIFGFVPWSLQGRKGLLPKT